MAKHPNAPPAVRAALRKAIKGYAGRNDDNSKHWRKFETVMYNTQVSAAKKSSDAALASQHAAKRLWGSPYC